MPNTLNMKNCKLKIDDISYAFEVEGDFFWGEDELLFPVEDNVISKVDWYQKGYKTVPSLSQAAYTNLKESIRKILIKIMQSKGVKVDDSFKLEEYHNYVKDDAVHNSIISETRELKNDDFDFDLDALAQNYSEVLSYELSSFNPELGRTHVQLRINRPNSLDINPPHRDGYLSYWSNSINVWIPIAGSNENSSLPILVGSHLINEKDILRTSSKGAKINGNTYVVPCILETTSGLEMIRPNPALTEAIIFTPFLIHGAAFNTNDNLTRFALELRLSKVND